MGDRLERIRASADRVQKMAARSLQEQVRAKLYAEGSLALEGLEYDDSEPQR